MPLSRTSLERQLQSAKSRLVLCVQSLDAGGVAPDDRRSDPSWRQFQANCRQLESRLRSLTAIETVDAELKQRKAEGNGDDAAEE